MTTKPLMFLLNMLLNEEKIITVDRVEGAVDYIEWKTNKGGKKSTNRIDDIIHLTPMGEEYVKKKLKLAKRKINYVGNGLCFALVMKTSVRENVKVLVVVKKVVQTVTFQIILKITIICIFARCVLYLNQNYLG